MARRDLSEHNVVATFADMETARRALDHLQRHGVEAERVSLMGSQVQEAAAERETAHRDRRMAGEVAKRSAAGSGAGVLVGAVVGLVLGLVVSLVADPGPVWAAALFGAVLGGAIGGFLGAFMGGVATLDLNPDWELTFDDAKGGEVFVVAHTDDGTEADRISEVLEGADPVRMQRLDAGGRRVDQA